MATGDQLQWESAPSRRRSWLARVVRSLSAWAWRADLDFFGSRDLRVTLENAYLREEVARLTHLLRETRATYRRLKGRSGGHGQTYWPTVTGRDLP